MEEAQPPDVLAGVDLLHAGTPLRGNALNVGLREPSADVIDELEWLLEAARSGEVVGIAYAASHHDVTTSNRYVGKMTLGLVGGLTAVTARVTRGINEE